MLLGYIYKLAYKLAGAGVINHEDDDSAIPLGPVARQHAPGTADHSSISALMAASHSGLSDSMYSRTCCLSSSVDGSMFYSPLVCCR